MLETIYVFSLVFAWMILVINGAQVCLCYRTTKSIAFDKTLYGLAVAAAWLIANR